MDHFCGRKDEIEQVYSRIRTVLTGNSKETDIVPQSTIIAGIKGMGRTSLLNYIYHKKNDYITDPKKFIFIFINPAEENINSPQDFFESLVGRLGKNVDGKTSHEENLDAYENLKNILSKLEEVGYKFVVFIDEFDYFIDKEFDESFYSMLRSLAPHHLAYVIATKRELKDYGTISSSPFFNIFAQIQLGLLEEKHIKESIEKCCNEKLSEEDIDFLLDIGGRYPLFIQIACSIFLEHKTKKGQFSDLDYKKIKKDVLNKSEKCFKEVFDDLSKKEKEVLVKIANNKHILERDNYILEDLVRKGYVIKEEKSFLFRKNIIYNLFSSSFKEFILNHGLNTKN